MTDVAVANSGPVFRLADEVAPTLARDVWELAVTEGTDGLRHLELVLQAGTPEPDRPNDPARFLDLASLDFGKRLQVFLGADAEQKQVFDGTISEIEAAYADGVVPLVSVCAEDAAMRLRMTRRMATYTDMTDAEIAAEIADQHGLQSAVDADGPRYDVVQQWNQSDLAFLRERARLIQAEVWCDGRTLHFATRDKRNPGELTLVTGNHLTEIRVSADLANQRDTVTLAGYDADGEAVIAEDADNDAVAAEIARGMTGPRLVKDKVGGSHSYRVREGVLTTADAQAFARADLLRRARGFVTAHGVTNGSSSMTVGTRLRLERVGPIFEGGGYYVTTVSHRYDLHSGYRTHFTAERSFINEVR